MLIARIKLKSLLGRREDAVEAAQSGPLAQAQATREVLAAQTELAQRQAELRQQQLVSEVVKPAEAEAERVRILALADAEKMKSRRRLRPRTIEWHWTGCLSTSCRRS